MLHTSVFIDRFLLNMIFKRSCLPGKLIFLPEADFTFLIQSLMFLCQHFSLGLVLSLFYYFLRNVLKCYVKNSFILIYSLFHLIGLGQNVHKIPWICIDLMTWSYNSHRACYQSSSESWQIWILKYTFKC